MALYKVAQCLPENWDQLVKGFPFYTVFHSLAWLRSIEACYPIRLFLLTLTCQGKFVAAWPVLEQRKGPFRIVGSPLPGWATVYLGPLFSDDIDIDAAITSFMDTYPFKGAAYIYCKVMNLGNEIDLNKHGFILKNNYKTYLLDLSKNEEVLWRNLKKGCKSSTKKAMKAGLEIRVEKSEDFIKDFWEMSVEVFGKSKIRPNYSLQLLRKLWAMLSESRNLIAISAYNKSNRIATLFLPCTDNTIYYWAGASYSKWKSLSPNNLLHWEAILEAKRCGIKCYDFVSIYGSAGKFKKSFGGTEHCTAKHWERYRYPWIRFAKDLYEWWLRRRMEI